MAVHIGNAAGAGGAFALLPAQNGRGGTDGSGQHPVAALLEVVRQGAWLGFRSAAAGGRFLQVFAQHSL